MTDPVPFLDLPAQHAPLADQILALTARLLQSAAFVGGPEVEAFEREFAAFCQAPHAVGVASGTDALRFALAALGVGPGDEVITVPNTFIATTEAISQVGATIRFVDVDPATALLDPTQLEAAITPRTRAIVPVHLYGQLCDMPAIMAVARRHGLLVVEDACQAHGAREGEVYAGSEGDAACYSFYPGKNLGACGEGGAVTVKDAEVAGRVRRLREHGSRVKYHHEVEGYNGRLDALQAGILRLKLPKLAGWNEARRAHAAAYRQALADLPGFELTAERNGAEPVYHLLVGRTDRRAALQAAFDAKRIGWGVHYPIPLHLQPAYAHLGLGAGSFPVAEALAPRSISLPLFPELTAAQRERVVAVVREVHA
jgi:dTDP-4-amino-4,6-dideoxygalactose transaminase